MRFKITLITLAVFILPSCINTGSSTETENYIVTGDEIPNFEVRRTDFNKSAPIEDERARGAIFNSDQFKGKGSLLFFYSTECGDCKKIFDRMQAIHDSPEIKDNPDYLIIGISRAQTRDVIDNVWNERGKEGETYAYSAFRHLDPNRVAFNQFANMTIPRLYIIDKDGIVTWYAVERLDESAKELIAKIKQAAL